MILKIVQYSDLNLPCFFSIFPLYMYYTSKRITCNLYGPLWAFPVTVLHHVSLLCYFVFGYIVIVKRCRLLLPQLSVDCNVKIKEYTIHSRRGAQRSGINKKKMLVYILKWKMNEKVIIFVT